MAEYVNLEMIDAAVAAIKSKTEHQPKVGLILGSGLGDLADSVQPADYIPFGEIPNWPKSTVQGHKGRLVIGELENKSVMIMQGRVHFYEGYPISMIGFPIRVMIRMGIENGHKHYPDLYLHIVGTDPGMDLLQGHKGSHSKHKQRLGLKEQLKVL